VKFAVAVAALAATLLLQGCRNTPTRAASPSTRAESPPCVLVDVDMSGSQTDKKLHQNFGMLDEVVKKVLPRDSRVVIWGYDYDVERQYDGRTSRAQDLWPAEAGMLEDRRQTLKQHPSVPGCKCRTRLSKALNENIEELQRLDTAGVASSLILLSDGEDAYPERAHGLVEQLAALRHLKAVWVIGVVPDTGENLSRQVRRIFEPVIGRLIVSERHDCGDGLRKFKELIQS